MTISEQIIQVIEALCEKFGVAINWTSDTILPYVEILCKKLITYEIVCSAFIIGFLITLSVVCIVLTKRLAPVYKAGLKSEEYDDACGWEMVTTVSILAVAAVWLTTLIWGGFEVADIIKCATFPEMYVFEYVSALLK